jgi:hypothetical protein
MRWVIASCLILLAIPAMAQETSLKNSDIYRRTLQHGNLSAPYQWSDGSMHTIMQPPPPRARAVPSPNSTAHAERSPPPGAKAGKEVVANASSQANSFYCRNNTHSAGALDRCVRAQHGEAQIEDAPPTQGSGLAPNTQEGLAIQRDKENADRANRNCLNAGGGGRC